MSLIALCLMMSFISTLAVKEHHSLRGRDLQAKDCSTVVCPAVKCNEGCQAVKPKGQCCYECRCKGKSCMNEACDVVDCLPGEFPWGPPGQCCQDQCREYKGQPWVTTSQQTSDNLRLTKCFHKIASKVMVILLRYYLVFNLSYSNNTDVIFFILDFFSSKLLCVSIREQRFYSTSEVIWSPYSKFAFLRQLIFELSYVNC